MDAVVHDVTAVIRIRLVIGISAIVGITETEAEAGSKPAPKAAAVKSAVAAEAVTAEAVTAETVATAPVATEMTAAATWTVGRGYPGHKQGD